MSPPDQQPDIETGQRRVFTAMGFAALRFCVGVRTQNDPTQISDYMGRDKGTS